METQTEKSKFNWKNILIGVIIGAIIVGTVAITFWYFTRSKEPALPTTTKTATSSAKTATPSSKTDETAGWKEFFPTGDITIPKYSFKYPPNLKTASNGVTTDVENVVLNGKPTKDVEFAGAWDKEGYFQAVTYGSGYYTNIVEGYATGSGENENQGWKLVSKNDDTLGGKKATRALFTLLGKPNDKTVEYWSEFEQGGKTKGVTFSCSFVVTTIMDLEKQCDLMASTFRFIE